MDIQATKLELIKHLLSVQKASVLEKIKDLLLADEDEIISFDTDGTPLNKAAYRAKVQKGLNDIEAGRVTHDEDLAKEIEILSI